MIRNFLSCFCYVTNEVNTYQINTYQIIKAISN